MRVIILQYCASYDTNFSGMCKKMTYSRFFSCLTLLAAVCGLSRSQPENVDIRNVNMQNVTQQLARRFEELRTVGLGLDALQVGCGTRMFDAVVVITYCFCLI